MKRLRLIAALCCLVGLAGCNLGATPSSDDTRAFPQPDRPVSNLGANAFSTEDQRDSRGEAESVMRLAEIEPGMVVADIGAGEGYYTVRLAEKVGGNGRVLAEDIDRDALTALGDRVVRQRLDNVSIKQGTPDDPTLPASSFDRVFMVHMYHEIAEPYAFLWHLWPSLRDGGQVVVVDVDRATEKHGIPPLLLSCEFEAVGFRLVAFKDSPELEGYYAQFERASKRPGPKQIKPCKGAVPQPGAATG